MQVIYRAYDGVDFTTAAECQHHEMNEPLFKMWASKGTTQDIDSAEVIEIYEWDGYEKFVEICAGLEYITAGIDGPGIYAWDGDEWVCMTNFPFVAINQYLRAIDIE